MRWHDAVDYKRGHWPTILGDLLTLMDDPNVVNIWFGPDNLYGHKKLTMGRLAWFVERNGDAGLLSAHRKLSLLAAAQKEVAP